MQQPVQQRARQRHRRGRQGLTLIEILTVVAILGLLFAVLIFFLNPGDDRRTMLEAERLAVYLTETAAEAIMIDGKARAAFELDEQTVNKEYARESADLSAGGFSRRDSDSTFTVRKPVKLTELIMPTNAVKAGPGWIVFSGRRTGGGVAILELNEAVYSVVVPPEGDVVVKKGRVGLPERPSYIQKEPLPDLSGFKFSDLVRGGGLPNFGGGGTPPSQPPAEPTNNDLNDDDPPNDDGDPEEPPEPPEVDDPTPPSEPPPEEEPPEEEPDAGPEEEHDCDTAVDCTEIPERYAVCQPDAEGTRRCVSDLTGLTMQLFTAKAELGESDLVGTILSSVMESQIAGGGFTMVVQFTQPAGPLGPNTPYFAAVVQAVPRPNGQLVAHPDKPIYYMTATPQGCAPGQLCHKLEPSNGRVKIYLDKSKPDPDSDCEYQLISVLASITVEGALSDPLRQLTLTGNLTRNDARRMEVSIQGAQGFQSAEKFLDDNDVYPNAACGADTPTCWSFSFTGSSREPEYPFNAPPGNTSPPPGCE